MANQEQKPLRHLPQEWSHLALRQQEIHDYSGTVKPLIPVSEVANVRLKPGPAMANLALFSSHKAVVLGAHHYTESVGVVVLQSGYFGYMWWDGEEECRINGQPCRRTVIYPQGAQRGFHATGRARRTMGVALRQSDLESTLAALAGIDREDVRLDDQLLNLSALQASRLRSRIWDIIERPNTFAPPGGRAPDPGEAIFEIMIESLLAAQPERLRQDRPRHAERIVRDAEEFFFSRQDTPISLADLCRAARVSQSTLYRAFDRVCGVAPMAYFHKRRLMLARKALINGPARRGAVKRAALSSGLTEFGRFAVEYRQLFGESPSATLAQHAR